MRVCVLISAVLCCATAVAAAEKTVPTFRMEQKWSPAGLRHQFEARGIYCSTDYVYTGSGGPDGVIAKVRLSDGEIIWKHPAESYQPSYPVSNGQVVVFGTYYKPKVVALDDRTGKPLWEVPTGQQNMSAARFSDDLVFIGSYDRYLYAIEWATGNVRWKAKLGSDCWSRPWVEGGQVLIGCYDGYLYSIDRKSGDILKEIDCTGVVESSPTVINNLVFVTAGTVAHGRPTAPTSDGEIVAWKGTRMLVIDLAQGKIVDEFKTDRKGLPFSDVTLVDGDRAYFYDYKTLYSYDTKCRTLKWKLDAPSIEPAPILSDGFLLLPGNHTGVEGQHRSRLVVVDPDTGKVLREQETGGIALRAPYYASCGDLFIATDTMQAYRVTRD